MLFERSGFSLESDTVLTSNIIEATTSSSDEQFTENLYCEDGGSYREKRIQHSADIEELIKALNGLNLERDYWIQTANRVESPDPNDRYEGTRQFRMMLSVSGDIPIQDVIDTGIVPHLVRFIGIEADCNLQFEAAWALTNIASGTCLQTEVPSCESFILKQVVVNAGAIPKLIDLLDNPREDIREQGMWGLGNIAGDRAEYRDIILGYPGVLEKFIKSCKMSRKTSTVRTGVWTLSNLCRGKPRPKFSLASPVVPYLSRILSLSEDSDTLSDACWALDGLSEHAAGIAAIITSGVVAILIRLLFHKELVVQRPALRVIGQVAAGDAEQTQEVLDNGVLQPLLLMLDSPRKSIRKDACWTLSNVAAGTPLQLQELLNAGIICKLVHVFQADHELEVKKEAAWAICNACTAQQQEQLEYLISCHCVKPVTEMLSIDDPKILDVALDALENILAFGDKMLKIMRQPTNICAELVKSCDGLTNLQQLHHLSHGFGSFVVWEKSRMILQRWFPEGGRIET